MRRSTRDTGPNQLALWPRHVLTDPFAPTRLGRSRPRRPARCTAEARARSGRVQAVPCRAEVRIGEKCRELFVLVRGRFQGTVLGWRFPGRKILDIFEGTQQIQKLIVARRLLGKTSAELK
jgi:alkylation response protein AidB-like acyl-CoA dehydrogenase